MADIVIRGMKMPKDKPVLVFIWPDGRVFPHGLYKPSEWDEVKAIPLPEGHGRLGDLDALQEEFKKSHDGKRLMLIDTTPTIVPAGGG